MEQSHLRELEAKCIQEEPPWCTAACPLHLDIRTFMAQAAKGDWPAARKTLERGLPLPAVLGRICDHPCEAACKRAEAGDPLRIGALERLCVQQAGQQSKPLPLPKKDFRVAVLGAGLAGLVAAFDLARKGFRVEVFTGLHAIGGPLLELNSDLLPPEALESELALLAKSGVVFSTSQLVDAAFLKRLRRERDVCFADLSEAAVAALFPEPGAAPDPLSLETALPGVFAGGDTTATSSPISDAAQGRKAAASIERFRQKVSLTAQREKEGPFATRLYTSLEGIEPLPATPMTDPSGYTPEEGRVEAARCLQCECLECVKNCLYLERFKGYPKKYAREIYNNAAIVHGTHLANKLINSCMLCGLCTSLCPHDFPMAALCLDARREMVRRDDMPPSAHDFALEELADAMSERAFLARHAPGTQKSGLLFFPGCQLAGTRPHQVRRIYDWLRDSQEKPVGLMLGCCGAPAHWAGRPRRFAEVLDQLRAHWTDLGLPRVVTACSTCQAMFTEHLPEMESASLWEFALEQGLESESRSLGQPLPLHDPCTTREQPGIRRAVRALLRDMGQEIEELPTGDELTECCGYGGLLMNANPPLARDVAARRAAQAQGDYLAYCAMCREALAATGKRVLHLLDLLFPPLDKDADPAALPAVTLSQRRENREALRRELLSTLWQQDAGEPEPHQTLKLRISPEVLQLMESRHILREDAQRVIHAAEASNKKFVNPDSGRCLACHRPSRVTYWVEYSPLENEVFAVHNAWSHRMLLPPAADARPRGAESEGGGQ